MSNHTGSYHTYPKPPELKRKKKIPGCLIFMIIVGIMFGVGYLFFTLEPRHHEDVAFSQEPRIYGELSESQHSAFNQLSAQSHRSPELQVQGGAIRALSLRIDMGFPENSQQQVANFMNAYQTLYKINEFANDFYLYENKISENNTILRYSQIIDSIPVYGSDLIFVLDHLGQIILVSGAYLPIDNYVSDLSLVYDRDATINSILEKGYIIFQYPSSLDLVVFNKTVLGHDKGETVLAWVVEATGCNGPVELVVSSRTGEILLEGDRKNQFHYEIIKTNDQFDFSRCELEFTCDQVLNDAVSIYQNSSNPISFLNEYDHLKNVVEETLEIYKNHLNWHGYDNNNSKFIILVGVNKGAFHWPILDCGTPVIGLDDKALISATDVFPHEFQHAITYFRIGLMQSVATPESGALNEAYSDIFTSLINQRNPWQIYYGDDLLRDMSKPTNVRYQVDHYKNFITENSSIGKEIIRRYNPCSKHFSHQNSTIISHAAYLVAEGGRKGRINIEGIGIGDMTKIFFNGQEYLPINATFFLARWATIQACEDYYGYSESSIKKCDDVRNAFAAVGIGDPVAEPDLLDSFLKLIDTWLIDIVEARTNFLDTIENQLAALDLHIDDFQQRMEQDLLKLFSEILLKLFTYYFQRILETVFSELCGSMALVGLPGLAFVIFKSRQKL